MMTTRVSSLETEIQDAIERDLRSAGLDEEDIERGMNSRLCDLEVTINIKPYLIQN